MELASVASQVSCFFPVTDSRARAPVISSIRNPYPILYSPHKITCCPLMVNPVRLRKFSIAAVTPDTTDVHYDYSPVSDPTPTCEESVIEGEKRDEKEGVKSLDDGKMIRVCDKLVGVFMVDKPTPNDWRRLLVFSKEWSNLRFHFYERCQDRADSEEDPEMKHKLLRLGRKLKEIDEDVQRHNELLEVIKGAPSEISQIVSRRRKDFTQEFFEHLHTVVESYYNDPAKQDDISKLGNLCVAAVQAYDTSESVEALNAAELKFQDIISSPSVDAACRKIDGLAEKNQLDSALVLMITKAWSAAKESNMMKEEAKDILYHLYMTARGNLQRLVPKEVRILKYLLAIEDPDELLCGLKDAFTPGEEIEGKDVDNLYTSPQMLYALMRTVVDAYNFSREGMLTKEAKDLMNPKIIEKIEELRKLVEKHFM